MLHLTVPRAARCRPLNPPLPWAVPADGAQTLHGTVQSQPCCRPRIVPAVPDCCMTPVPPLSPNLLFQKSLKQRLGKSNIQARLGRPAGTLARGALGGRGLALGQRGLPRGALRGRGARAMLRGGVALRGQCRAVCLSPVPSSRPPVLCPSSSSRPLSLRINPPHVPCPLPPHSRG